MPHFGHVTGLTIIEVGVEVLTDVVIGVRKISSRSGIGRRVTCWGGGCVGAPHTVSEIEPDEPTNMPFLLAFEWTQAGPQSF